VRRGYGWRKGFRASGSYCDPSLEISACCKLLKIDGIDVDQIDTVEGPFENIQSAFLDYKTLLTMDIMAGRALSKPEEMLPKETAIVSRVFLQTLVAIAAKKEDNGGD
jgi:hypothetical protein